MKKIPKVRMVKVVDLIPYEKNPKDHPEDQVERIVKSIKRFGWLKNIVIDKGNLILAGHGAVLAAKKLGLERVPATIADHLSPEDARAYRIADNKSAESQWIQELLHEEVKVIKAMVGDDDQTGLLDAIGFTAKQLEEMLQEARSAGQHKTEEDQLFPFTLLFTADQRHDVLKAFALIRKQGKLKTHNELFLHLVTSFLEARNITYPH